MAVFWTTAFNIYQNSDSSPYKMIITICSMYYIISDFQALGKTTLKIGGSGQNSNQMLFYFEPNMRQVRHLFMYKNRKSIAYFQDYKRIRAPFPV
jgi:hypothetical protein